MRSDLFFWSVNPSPDKEIFSFTYFAFYLLKTIKSVLILARKVKNGLQNAIYPRVISIQNQILKKCFRRKNRNLGQKWLHFEFTISMRIFQNIFLGANIDENGTTSIPGGLCQSQKLSLANQSLRGSKLNISGLSEYDSFLWRIELSINEQGSVMQIRGQAI